MKDPNLLTTVAFREWNMKVGGDRMGKSFELYVLHFVTHFFILSYFLRQVLVYRRLLSDL